jgi:biopolymer transport protein ExbB
MDSQFGLINVWTQGDIVTKGVFLLLLGMSLASWIVILIKVLDLRKFAAQSRRPRASGTPATLPMA